MTISSPTYASLRTHQGEVVGEGNWPPLISVEEHERLLAIFADPARRTTTHRGSEPRRLLTGIARCGVCGAGMRWLGANTRTTPRYLCAAHSCVGRRSDMVDALVTETVIERLSRPDAQALFAQAGNQVVRESVDVAAAMPPQHAEVEHAVKRAVLAKLVDIYQPVALPNYQRLATEFDGIARAFAAAANTIDPETPADHLVHAQEKIRKAWSAAEQHAHQLTEMMTRLAAGANLCGVADTEKGETLIPLTLDTTGCHRRRTWEAWRVMSGRTGRWGAVLKLGAAIRAADLDGLEPYRLPKPMEIKQIPHGIGVRQVSHDPEDAELAEAVAEG